VCPNRAPFRKVSLQRFNKKTFIYSNISGEKTTQHNAYELFQLKNDYAVCKQQKAILEEDLSDQRQEITEPKKRIK